MKKYLLTGLVILLGTNLLVLGGVTYNRMGEATAHLTLTERELALPYNSSIQQENSGTSLYIDWRTPTGADEIYYSYSTRDIKISKGELLKLGFTQIEVENDYSVESRELFWALEFDGALHKAEIDKAAKKYQHTLVTYEKQPNDGNLKDKKEYSKNLEREKVSNSRLFFVEAASDYRSLVDKFSGQQNILIVKGFAKPFYNSQEESYSLMLGQLSVSNIMVPLTHTEVFSKLTRLQAQDIKPPRYSVDIKWGSRLEPWIVSTMSLAE
jgi:hypothetical protein